MLCFFYFLFGYFFQPRRNKFLYGSWFFKIAENLTIYILIFTDTDKNHVSRQFANSVYTDTFPTLFYTVVIKMKHLTCRKTLYFLRYGSCKRKITWNPFQKIWEIDGKKIADRNNYLHGYYQFQTLQFPFFKPPVITPSKGYI